MITLAAILVSTALISAIARLLGSSKKVAVLLAMLPMAVNQFLFSVSFITVVDSHGHRIPICQMILAGMLVAFVLALVVAAIVKKRQPNKVPLSTPASVTPAGGAPGAPPSGAAGL
jgi:predicted transporter